MYVGGILSHIVISIVLGHADPTKAYHVGLYKESSAYVLILPGLATKVAVDLALFFWLGIRDNWLKLKMLMMAFLAINAFVFLVPMMSVLTALALDSIPDGQVSQLYLDQARVEQLIGMSNVIPLALELLLGSFRPKLGRERDSHHLS